MAILGVDDFKSKISGGGARANLFKATINFPAYAGGDAEFTSFMVKAAGLPSSNLGLIEIPFRGRVLKIAGDRTFEPWTITIMNDKNFVLRNAFESWAQGVQEYTQNVTTAGSDVGSYFKDMRVIQYDRFGDLKDSADAEEIQRMQRSSLLLLLGDFHAVFFSIAQNRISHAGNGEEHARRRNDPLMGPDSTEDLKAP